MKNRKPTKIPIIIMIVLIQSLIVGAGWFSVGLRNTDSKNPLVNINALIGGSGMPDPSLTPQTEQDQTENDVEETEQDEDNTEPTEPKISTEIKVRVRGKTILINDGMTPESAFESRFQGLYDKSKKVILIDDYADFQTYSKILEYFETNSIKFKEEPSTK